MRGGMAQEKTSGRRELEKSLEAARGRVLQALLEADWLELFEIPQIEATLVGKVGLWRNELERCELQALQAERRCELARKELEQRGSVDVDAVEREVEWEFAQRSEQLRKQERACSAVINGQRVRECCSAERESELKELHRTLISRLHPLLNPWVDDTARTKFRIARLALKKVDVTMMRSVEDATRMLERATEASWRLLSEEELNAEVVLMEAKEPLAVERLVRVKLRSPYTMRAHVASSDWVQGKVGEICEQIERNRERVALYQAYYLELVSKAA